MVRSRRLRLLRAVVAALAVVVAAEVSVRFLEPALPTPPLWADLATATKVAQLEHRAETGCTDVVFVGSSMTRDDLVPHEFSAADPAGRTAYNAALDAASPALLRRWLTEQVLPRTEPATVIVGVSTFDLNDAATIPTAAREAHADAPASASGPLAAIERTAIEHLALVRHRIALRNPAVVLEAVVDRLSGERADRPSPAGIPGVLAEEGHGLSRRELRFQGDSTTIDRARRQLLEPFELGGEQAAALTELLGDIRSHGAMPVLVQLPVTDDFVAAHPRGSRDVARAERMLQAIADATDTTLIEPERPPERAFADTHHLNAIGADALSRRLPELLAQADVPATRCPPG